MAEMWAQNDEAVVISLDTQGLDDAVYQTHDLYTLEDLLIKELESDGIGQLDGHEISPTQTTIYLYGPDAEEIFSKCRTVLASYPLCRNSRAVIRWGGPGSSQREAVFPYN